MGIDRISAKDLEEKVQSLNTLMKNRGVDVVFDYNPRSNYAAVDYETSTGGCMTLISGVSNRECFNHLCTVVNVIHLMNEGKS